MAKPLKCDICNKPATVHLTQIINNQIHKIDLCEECAEQKGITDPSGYSLADLLVKPETNFDPLETGALVCPECGCTQREFKKTGRLGCPRCYETFSTLVAPALASMHRGEMHKGKFPARAAQRKTYLDRLGSLESDLKRAVDSERYEDAAKVRDEIIELKKSMNAATEKE